MPVFATKSTFERLRLKNKNIVKIDVESEEFEAEYSRQMKSFKNYKWTLASIPNGIILTYLIPSRYPMTIRGTVGYMVCLLGWYGHQRAAHNRTVRMFKKQMIMDHFEDSDLTDAEREKAKKRLFGDQYTGEELQTN